MLVIGRGMVLAAVVGGLSVLTALPSRALNFDPTRVVLTERQRTAVVRVFNPGTEAQRYTIQWVDMRMTRERGLTIVEDASALDGIEPARDLVFFAPRQATVPAESSQTLRLMARPPQDLPDGEYRSHLLITQPPDRDESGGSNGDGTTTQIQRVSRTTIPVIYRQGDPDLQVEATDAKLVRKGDRPALRIQLARSGAKSLYGDVEILWRGDDGKELVLNETNGIAVYPELDSRSFTHRLFLPNQDEVPPGRVVYRLREHSDGNQPGKLLTETEVRVP